MKQFIMVSVTSIVRWGPYDSWIHNYLCNQCLSPLTSEFESRSGVVYSIQHHVIKFVNDLPQVSGFLRRDITEILMKVALNTTTHNPNLRCINNYLLFHGDLLTYLTHITIGFIAIKDFKIIWFSNLLTLSVPGEGYSRNTLCVWN